MNPLVVVIGAEVDHEHEERDQLEHDVQKRSEVGLGPASRQRHIRPSIVLLGGDQAQAGLAVLAAATSELMVRSATLVASMVI